VSARRTAGCRLRFHELLRPVAPPEVVVRWRAICQRRRLAASVFRFLEARRRIALVASFGFLLMALSISPGAEVQRPLAPS
jgi:hypothetical protein